MSENLIQKTREPDPHTFSVMPPLQVELLPDVLDKDRPRRVFQDPATGERFVEISDKNWVGDDNRPLGQWVIGSLLKGVVRVAEPVPLSVGNPPQTIIASRLIDLSKTEIPQVDPREWTAHQRADVWILLSIFGDTDRRLDFIDFDHNQITDRQGRISVFDFGTAAETLFRLGPVVAPERIAVARGWNLGDLLRPKLELLKQHLLDGDFINALFMRVNAYYPNASMGDLFKDGDQRTVVDFRDLLFARVDNALQELSRGSSSS